MTEFEVIAPSRRSGVRPLHLVGLALIALALWLGMSALGKSLTPYVSVAEAESAAGQAVQVKGYPRGSAPPADDGVFRFQLEDDFGRALQVEYRQPKPGNFDQAISVVAVGSYDAGRQVFVADDLLVKCPSKYQDQESTALLTQ